MVPLDKAQCIREGLFIGVRGSEILGSSLLASNAKATANIIHLQDAPVPSEGYAAPLRLLLKEHGPRKVGQHDQSRSPPLPYRRSGRGTRRPPSAHRDHAVARKGDRRRSVPGCATRDDSGTRALLGHRLRLAQGGGETESPTAIHDRDRWA